MSTFDAEALAKTLAERVVFDRVDWMVVCGSGLGQGLMEGGLGLTVEHSVALVDLGLPAPSVEGHGHALVFGTLGKNRVCLQTGRLHPYEGLDVRVCTAALRAVLQRWSPHLLLTCAVGALSPDLVPGQLVCLRDQINLFGPTPLVGPQFVDCANIYTPALRQRLQTIATAGGDPLPEVVYAHARGPQYETAAETLALRRLGGDVVGMSTTYEGILAAALGISTCGVGVVTNAAGVADLTHEEVQERGAAARDHLSRLAAALLSSPTHE